MYSWNFEFVAPPRPGPDLDEVVHDGERDEHGEEDGRAVRDDEQRREHGRPRAQPDADRLRHVDVDHVHVLRETVQDATCQKHKKVQVPLMKKIFPAE